MNEEDRRQVVFLDTNALHYMHLYLTHACNESLYPFCPNDGSGDEARRIYAQELDTALKQAARSARSPNPHVGDSGTRTDPIRQPSSVCARAVINEDATAGFCVRTSDHPLSTGRESAGRPCDGPRRDAGRYSTPRAPIQRVVRHQRVQAVSQPVGETHLRFHARCSVGFFQQWVVEVLLAQAHGHWAIWPFSSGWMLVGQGDASREYPGRFNKQRRRTAGR